MVARAGALGDLVLLGPALWDLRASGHEVVLLAPARLAGPLQAAGLVQAVLDWEAPCLGEWLAGTVPERWRDEVRSCELALAYSRGEALWAALGGAGLRTVAHDPHPRPGIHAAEWLRAPLARLGVSRSGTPPPPWPTAPLDDGSSRLLAALGGPGFLSVHMGSGSPRKNWPAERFERLAESLARGRPWLHVSGPAEAERAFAGAIAARELPLEQLAALLARAGLHVGNDAGVSHLAAAVGAPTLALFGPTDPAAWAPIGRAARSVAAPGGELPALGVDEVRQAALDLRSEARALPSG